MLSSCCKLTACSPACPHMGVHGARGSTEHAMGVDTCRHAKGGSTTSSYLAVDDRLGHSEHDGLAHRPHIRRCVLSQLLQVVVKDL